MPEKVFHVTEQILANIKSTLPKAWLTMTPNLCRKGVSEVLFAKFRKNDRTSDEAQASIKQAVAFVCHLRNVYMQRRREASGQDVSWKDNKTSEETSIARIFKRCEGSAAPGRNTYLEPVRSRHFLRHSGSGGGGHDWDLVRWASRRGHADRNRRILDKPDSGVVHVRTEGWRLLGLHQILWDLWRERWMEHWLVSEAGGCAWTRACMQARTQTRILRLQWRKGYAR